MRSYCLMGRVTTLGDKKSSVDSGDVCMVSNLLNATDALLKTVTMISFMLCVFYKCFRKININDE